MGGCFEKHIHSGAKSSMNLPPNRLVAGFFQIFIGFLRFLLDSSSIGMLS